MPDYTLVDEPETIRTELAAEDTIGVDTEFMRERTYFAELSLVQVATRTAIYCIDPLAESDMNGFWQAAFGARWVLHSARQDMEVVYQAAERLPDAVFDTQIAAGLLGYQPQAGYGTLVRELCAVELPKSHTRADWSRRPLPDALLRYAAEDVQYLLPMYDQLRKALDARGRLAWAEEDSAALLDPALYAVEPAAALDRVKGGRNLRGRRRAAAARLAAWREREALRANRPRQWIFKDAVLLELAQKLPDSSAALARIDGLAPGLVRRAGNALLAELRAAAEDAPPPPPARPDQGQRALLGRLQSAVAARADELGIAAEVLAPRRELAVLVNGSDDGASRVVSGWRRDVIGRELEALL
ncbi:MAG: ribonuclease D [Woeseiaceae bacterium]|nr:ribonuclease D [Woeseiaceae bacterium]